MSRQEEAIDAVTVLAGLTPDDREDRKSVV